MEKINDIEKSKGMKKEKGEKERKEAVARGKDLPISTKQSIAICRFIRGKMLNKAIEELEKVEKKKKAIAMKGEFPHRKGISKSGGGGRYPIKAAKVFIKLLKSLSANAAVKGLDTGRIEIYAKADKAGRPRKPGRKLRKFKRTHITLIGKEK